MTRKLYWGDSYQKEFDAKVISINGNQVILDQTCFYPRSGGQPGDTGEINGIRVIDTVFDNNKENVIHILEKVDFKVNDTVHGVVDWDRRYKIMKLHSAAHVISIVLVKNFGNIMFTGSQIYEDRVRMDFNLEKLDDEVVKIVEDESNKIVQASVPITAKIMNKEELKNNPNLFRVDPSLYEKYNEFRVVNIENFDIQLDGGTHVKNTSEIGRIKIVGRENKGKNNKRIVVVVE